MGHRIVAAVSISAILMLAHSPLFAQNQPRSGQLPPAGGQRPPAAQPAPQQAPQQQAAAKPYKAVTITLAKPLNDPSLDAFRKQLAEAANKKDRAALAGLVSKSFFWMGEKDKADKKKSGIDNLSKAIGLDGKDAEGWDVLASFVGDPTGGPYEDKKDTICSPGQPDFNDDEFGAMLKATGTEDGDWAYPVQTGIEMHTGAQPNSPVVEKLGSYFVRVMQDETAANQQVPMLKVVAPSGKTGYVAADALSSLDNDMLCYVKEGGAWKIGGYIGGADQ
jgi:hypothetical protein